MSNIIPSITDLTGKGTPEGAYIKLPPEREKRQTFRSVAVKAPARLHLGFLDMHGGLGRRFGSLGLAIDQPSTKFVVSSASAFSAHGPEADRALKAAHRYGTYLAPDLKFCVDVERAIPAHAGLGSGTQLNLAIGTAIARIAEADSQSARIATMAERGARSAIGVAAFEHGGFIVDGGKPAAHNTEAPPPVLARVDFPPAWRVILILDEKGAPGVYGDREVEAFAKLPEFPAASAAHICRLTLMRLLPALHETDLAGFGAALTEIQATVGEHFASAQGGSPWSSAAVGQIAGRLADGGAVGIGQSSWGPTGFAFTPTADAAKKLYHSLVGDAKALGLKLLIAEGRNSPARVESRFA